MKNRIFTALTGICIAVLIITVSIGLPIYVRPFYYSQIDALNIEQYSGADRETIIEAYDELLDYLPIPGKELRQATSSTARAERLTSRTARCSSTLTSTLLLPP